MAEQKASPQHKPRYPPTHEHVWAKTPRKKAAPRMAGEGSMSSSGYHLYQHKMHPSLEMIESLSKPE